jgi:integrase
MRMTDKVTVRPTKHERYSWVVRWPGEGGKRVAKLFNSKAEADACAKEQRKELGDTGEGFSPMTEPERFALGYWRALAARTQDNPPPPLLDILTDYGKRWEASQAGCTVAAAVESFLESKRAEIGGEESPNTLALKTRLGKFAAAFGPRIVATISTAEISDWILGLSGPKKATARQIAKGRPVKSGALSMQTKKNHRLAVHAFFAWAKSRGMTGANPVTDSAKPKVPKVAPGILKPAEVGAFLAAIASTPEIVPFWSVRIFAGIRESEACRMTWEMVDLGKLKINLPATVTKTGRPRGVDIQPALAAFLQPLAKKTGPLAPKSEMARRWQLSKAFPEGHTAPRNWARHTFATMHLHGFQDAGKTSLQLGHGESPEMLHAHYASYATDEDAAAFWEIRPETLPQPGNVIPLHESPSAAETPATVKLEAGRAAR